MNKKEIYQALLDGHTVVSPHAAVRFNEDGVLIDEKGRVSNWYFDHSEHWQIRAPRHLRKWLVDSNGWRTTDVYLDDDGCDSTGRLYCPDWADIRKVRIESGFIRINEKGELLS